MSDRRRRSSIIKDKPPVNPAVGRNARIPGRPVGRPGAREVVVIPVNPELVDKPPPRRPSGRHHHNRRRRDSSRSPARRRHTEERTGRPSRDAKGKGPAPLPPRPRPRTNPVRIRARAQTRPSYTPEGIISFVRTLLRISPSSSVPSTSEGILRVPPPSNLEDPNQVTTMDVFETVLGPAMRVARVIGHELQIVPVSSRVTRILKEAGRELLRLFGGNQNVFFGVLNDPDFRPESDVLNELYNKDCDDSVINTLKARISMIEDSAYIIICNILYIRNFVSLHESSITASDITRLDQLLDSIKKSVDTYFDLPDVQYVLGRGSAPFEPR